MPNISIESMAFAPALDCSSLRATRFQTSLRCSRHQGRRAALSLTSRNPARSFIFASAQDSQTELTDLNGSRPVSMQMPDLKSDQAAAAAHALFDDLADRPEYYLNVSGVLLGIALSCVVLSATLVALESIPFVPDALRMVGLAYFFWFLNKFLFSAGERERLGSEVAEFVSSVRGRSAVVLDEFEDA